MKKIIVLKSEDRCGKDTIANVLKEIYEKENNIVKIVSFGKSLKDFTADILKIDAPLLDKLKNDNVTLTIDGEEIKTRDYIIRIGKIIKKHFGGDIFTYAIKDIINSGIDILIIPDIRFKFEYDFIKLYNPCIIEIISNDKKCGENNKRYELDMIPSNLTYMNDYIFNNVEKVMKERVCSLIKSINDL